MNSKAISEFLDEQDWLEAVDSALQTTADATINQGGEDAQKLREKMHGYWLGHPVHPVITDVPIGAWTVTALLDIVGMMRGDGKWDKGADAALNIGLLGAVGAALTGLNDWQATDGSPRRTGSAHAMFNITATVLYLVSRWLRFRGRRGAGRTLGLIGYGFMSAGAFLGGHLVYEQKIGVNHAPDIDELPEEWTPVLAESELAEGKPARVEADGVRVLLVRRGQQIFAIGEVCAHLGGPLAEGRLEGNCVRCPWHGSLFSLESGRCIEGPSAYPQPRFETRVREGQIEVRASHRVE
jgi:nitrite reductase/ring-hydroxylating ferredoxin subunit/uncharacterized membrane protein